MKIRKWNMMFTLLYMQSWRIVYESEKNPPSICIGSNSDYALNQTSSDSSVGIVTGNELKHRGIGVRVPVG
jgi:hypothetical protein